MSLDHHNLCRCKLCTEKKIEGHDVMCTYRRAIARFGWEHPDRNSCNCGVSVSVGNSPSLDINSDFLPGI